MAENLSFQPRREVSLLCPVVKAVLPAVFAASCSSRLPDKAPFQTKICPNLPMPSLSSSDSARLFLLSRPWSPCFNTIRPAGIKSSTSASTASKCRRFRNRECSPCWAAAVCSAPSCWCGPGRLPSDQRPRHGQTNLYGPWIGKPAPANSRPRRQLASRDLPPRLPERPDRCCRVAVAGRGRWALPIPSGRDCRRRHRHYSPGARFLHPAH